MATSARVKPCLEKGFTGRLKSCLVRDPMQADCMGNKRIKPLVRKLCREMILLNASNCTTARAIYNYPFPTLLFRAYLSGPCFIMPILAFAFACYHSEQSQGPHIESSLVQLYFFSQDIRELTLASAHKLIMVSWQGTLASLEWRYELYYSLYDIFFDILLLSNVRDRS